MPQLSFSLELGTSRVRREWLGEVQGGFPAHVARHDQNAVLLLQCSFILRCSFFVPQFGRELELGISRVRRGEAQGGFQAHATGTTRT